MLMKLTTTKIPQILKGSILINKIGIPRYWSAIYSIYFFTDLAENTKNLLVMQFDLPSN